MEAGEDFDVTRVTALGIVLYIIEHNIYKNGGVFSLVNKTNCTPARGKEIMLQREF